MTPDNDSTSVIDSDRLLMQGQAFVESPIAAVRGKLLQASVVEREQDPSAPLPQTVAWIRTFLARPHPDVGRPGPVCPFTPTALALDTIWLAEIHDRDVSVDRITQLIGEYRDLFAEIEPRTGQVAINKTVLIVFPHLGDEAAAFIDEVQQQLKPSFVDLGLMLGEFHATNESPGLRNPDFRPLRSPVPMLAIRHMVETDLPFLRRSLDTPQVRGQYLRSYLRRLGPTVRRNYFEQALTALVDAELEVRALKRAKADKTADKAEKADKPVRA